MIEDFRRLLFDIHPLMVPCAGLLALLLVAWISDVFAKRRLIRLARRIAGSTRTALDDTIIAHGVIERVAQLLPAIVIYLGIGLVPELPEAAEKFVRNVALAVLALLIVMAISAVLSAANAIYELRPDSDRRPIKGYVQLAKIIVYCIGAILVVAALLDRSPVLLLSGFGAATAILLLVFRDTILSLVASIQLSSLDMVRVGDWIEMPELNADGDVIDVALHTVRVQNWDKTITTIPTHRLISDSFRNWRGMSESGGRRIKRSLLIDGASVRFLSPQETDRLCRIALLEKYIEDKKAELKEYNQALDSKSGEDVNLRRLTNLGSFRAYVYNYLKNHPMIRKDMTLMVRQLAPGDNGIPIEIYCFTNTTVWSEYEGVQADIFDFLFAILDEFDLRAFQQPSGHDFAALSRPH